MEVLEVKQTHNGQVTADEIAEAYNDRENAPWGVDRRPVDPAEIRTGHRSGAQFRRLLDALVMEGNRYVMDSFLVFSRRPGWRQYDTENDAWYFGTWVNPVSWQVVTYAEGDLTLDQYLTADDMKKTLLDMADFYGEQPASMIVLHEDGTREDVFDINGRTGPDDVADDWPEAAECQPPGRGPDRR